MDKIKTYQDYSDAMLKMWNEDILTDGEYDHIIDKLNAWYKKQLN